MLVRGELTHRRAHRAAPDSVAIVELTRPQDGRVMAEQRIALDGRQVPIAFELRVRRAASRRHRLCAARRDRGARRTGAVAQRADRRAPGARRRERRRAACCSPCEAVAFAAAPRLRRRSRARRPRAARRRRRPAPGGRRRALRTAVRRQRLRRALRSGERPDHAALGQGRPRDADAARRGLAGMHRHPRRARTPSRARGNEPDWRLDLGNALRFVSRRDSVEGTAPPAQYVGGVRQHVGTVAGRSVTSR